jgi:hypothetical protein
LKREIKLHLRTIEVLQERQKRQTQASEELQKFIESSDLIDNIRDVVVELCQNMVDRGAVPTDRSQQRGRGLDPPSTAPTTLNHHTIPARMTSATLTLPQRGQSPVQNNRIDQPLVVSLTLPRDPRLDIKPNQPNSQTDTIEVERMHHQHCSPQRKLYGFSLAARW